MKRTLAGMIVTTALAWGSASVANETESVNTAMCRLIHEAAKTHQLPEAYFTRLIWRESSFRARAVSPAGAQGVAQFMPGTASERGLLDPFDPEQAIPAAAKFIADLHAKYGNLGLAAAAYNAGPGRVATWLRGSGSLFAETRDYVLFITGRSVEDWASPGSSSLETSSSPCLQVIADLKVRGRAPTSPAFAPWGIQLAANFSRDRALSSFKRTRAQLSAVLPDIEPMIIGTRLRTRGTRPFYRVRIPQATRSAADALCARVRAAGGSCIVLPS